MRGKFPAKTKHGRKYLLFRELLHFFVKRCLVGMPQKWYDKRMQNNMSISCAAFRDSSGGGGRYDSESEKQGGRYEEDDR